MVRALYVAAQVILGEFFLLENSWNLTLHICNPHFSLCNNKYICSFVYSSFSSFLRWELRLLIWGFLHFKCKHLVIKKIAFLALVVPHKFWCVILSFSFSPMYFAFFLRFPLSWLSSYLEVSCLIFMCWDFPIVLFFFFFNLFIDWFHYGEKHSLNDFNCFKFAEVCFLAQDIVCLGECSIGIWKKGCIQLIVVECSV